MTTQMTLGQRAGLAAVYLERYGLSLVFLAMAGHRVQQLIAMGQAERAQMKEKEHVVRPCEPRTSASRVSRRRQRSRLPDGRIPCAGPERFTTCPGGDDESRHACHSYRAVIRQ